MLSLCSPITQCGGGVTGGGQEQEFGLCFNNHTTPTYIILRTSQYGQMQDKQSEKDRKETAREREGKVNKRDY